MICLCGNESYAYSEGYLQGCFWKRCKWPTSSPDTGSARIAFAPQHKMPPNMSCPLLHGMPHTDCSPAVIHNCMSFLLSPTWIAPSFGVWLEQGRIGENPADVTFSTFAFLRQGLNCTGLPQQSYWDAISCETGIRRPADVDLVRLLRMFLAVTATHWNLSLLVWSVRMQKLKEDNFQKIGTNMDSRSSSKVDIVKWLFPLNTVGLWMMNSHKPLI